MSSDIISSSLIASLADNFHIDATLLAQLIAGEAAWDCTTLERVGHGLLRLGCATEQVNQFLAAGGCLPLINDDSVAKAPSQIAPNIEAFGTRVRAWINELGWTQDDFADALGRSRSHINRVLHGKSNLSPKLSDTIIKLLAEYGKIRSQDEGNALLALAGRPRLPDEEWVKWGVPALNPSQTVEVAKLKADLASHSNPHDIPVKRYRASLLAWFIRDRLQPPHLRARVMELYVAAGHNAQTLLEEMVYEYDESVRKQVALCINDYGVRISRPALEQLLCDSSNDVVTKAIVSAKVLINAGIIPTEVLGLSCIITHHYWVVRRDAIKALIELDRTESVELLCRFRSTTHLASRKAICRYFTTLYDQDRLADQQVETALDLLSHYAIHTDAIPEESSSLRLILATIEKLKGRNG